MNYLILIDLDGTALNDNHEFDKETIDTIQKLDALGHKVCINTGRTYSESIKYFNDLGIDTLYATGNGKEIYKPLDIDFAAVKKRIKTKTILEFMESIKEYLVNYRITKGMNIYFKKYCVPNWISSEEMILNFDGINKDIEEYELCFFNVDVTKIYEVVRIIKKDYPEYDMRILGENKEEGSVNIELMAKNTSKKTAGEFMMNYYNIDYNNVIAIGDNNNDVSMLSYFNSASMENATHRALEVSNRVIGHNNSLGVSNFLKEYFNI